jgi:hypothetical protein
MADALLVVFSDPVAGADEEFNRWYTEVHVPDVIKLGGARCGRRYRASGVPLLAGIPEPGRYAAVYEVQADTVAQIEAIAARFAESLTTGEADISPSMDLPSVQAAWLFPVTDTIDSPERTGAPSTGAPSTGAPGTGGGAA